jgi:hypothetical protein
VVEKACKALTGVVAMLFAWVLIAGISASAQVTGLATMSGPITDTSGAVIVGAQVTATNDATNVSQNSITNSTGYYELDSLTPGIYKIAVTAPGFEKLVREGITLEAAARLNVPLSLSAGRVNATVTVNADASMINTDSGSQGQVLTARQAESLPVNGGNSFQFMEIAPGIQSANSQTYSMDGTLMWNGVSNFGTAGIIGVNEYSLDGAPNEGSGRGNAISLSVDELGEQKMDVSGYDASVGHTMGVAITQTTKNGTNDVHGTLRAIYQNRRWAAMQHFQGLNYQHELYVNNCTNGPSTSEECAQVQNLYGQPGVHENNDGFAIGGPVFIPKLYDGRNKFFWFTSYDNDIFSDASANTINIPTLRERTGDFSDLPQQTGPAPAAFQAACGANAPYFGQYQIYNPTSVVWSTGTTPSRSPVCGNNLATAGLLTTNAMAKLYNSLMPTPSNSNATGSNYTYEALQPQTFRQFTQRFDYALNSNNHIFFRWTRAVYSKIGDGFTTGDVDYSQEGRWIDTGAANWNHIFNASTNLDVTVGATSYKDNCCQYPGENAYTPSQFGLPSYADTYGAQASGNMMPEMEVSNYQTLGSIDDGAQVYRTLAVRANLTHVQAHHTIRAGFEWRSQNYSRSPQGNLNGLYTFDDTYTQQNNGTNPAYSQNNTGLAYAALMMGIQTNSAVSLQASESVSTPFYAGYIGDTWRVTRKLNIIPGIRFEFEHGPTEKHNQQIVGWNANAALPIAAPANSAYQPIYAGASAAEQAVLPTSLTIQGGPEYAGVNGAPTDQFVSDYRFLPRLAVAYQITPATVIRGGYGLFFDTLNALEQGGTPGSGAPGTPGSLLATNWSTDQDGFSASTSVPSSTTYGTNFLPGVSPLSNPFPENANGTQFNAPIGSAAGDMYYVGASPSIYSHGMVPAREHRASFSVQRQLGASTLLEVAWVGSYTTHIPLLRSYSYTPAQFYTSWVGMQPNVAASQLLGSTLPNPFQLSNFASIASSNPAAYNLMSLEGFFTSASTTVGNLVHANPQGGLSLYQSIGASKFQELQVNVNRRYKHGLTFMTAFQWNSQRVMDWFVNGFDTYPSWRLGNNSAPFRLTAEGVYELPFGRNKKWANTGWQSAIFGGFQLNATYEVSPGAMINWGSEWYIGKMDAANIQLKHPIFHNDIEGGNNYIQWINPGNVTATYNANGSCTYSGQGFVANPQCQPNYNTTEFPPYISGVRAKGPDQVQASVQRTFHLRNRLSLETRFEAYNILNRQVFSAFPNTVPTSPQFGEVTGDGAANGSGNARWIDISGKLRF